ncbi:MAG: nitrite reductase small subunit NirD [Polyangiaceae bacterium]
MSMQALVEVTWPETDPKADVEWREVCSIDDVLPGAGVAALLDGEQIAIVRTRSDQWFALSNFDPFSNAFVIARGIVGDRAGIAKIASPIYKQNFSLETGLCLDDPSVRLQVFPIRVVAGRVQVSLHSKVAG